MSFLAVHSFKGGTGKTSVSVNLAAIIAASGKSACILDWDFSGPSFHDIFDFSSSEIEYYLNDFIVGECEPQDALIDISGKLGTKGKFWVGFASPDPSDIREIARKGRKWQMRALSRIFNLRRELDTLDVDLAIFDTSPGIHYSSINAIISSDVVIIVMKPYKPDFGGTKRMISAIHESLEKKSYLLINKAPVEVVLSPSDTNSLKSKVEGLFEDTKKVELLGLIPCYCSVAQFDSIIALDHEAHPFVTFLRSFLPKITNFEEETVSTLAAKG
ncbi:MAG: MinD/ParA family ATP-binding protein [Candidatus Hodarchaeales archaeon]|jgi:septum site-determining protein MinD